jgi:hypothetical protein
MLLMEFQASWFALLVVQQLLSTSGRVLSTRSLQLLL